MKMEDLQKENEDVALDPPYSSAGKPQGRNPPWPSSSPWDSWKLQQEGVLIIRIAKLSQPNERHIDRSYLQEAIGK